MKIAKVIVDVPAQSVDHLFDYLIPEKFDKMLMPGMRVVLPFGPRKITGFVVDITEHTDVLKVKELIDVLDVTPVLSGELISLGKWLASQTLCLNIIAYQAMLPTLLKSKYTKEIERLTDMPLKEEWERLFAGRTIISFDDFVEDNMSYKQLQTYLNDGDLTINYKVKSNITRKYRTMIKPQLEGIELDEAFENISQRAHKQRDIVAYFMAQANPIEKKHLLSQFHTSNSTIKQLVDDGVLITYKEEIYRHPYDDDSFVRTEPLTLTSEQEEAIQPIEKSLKNNEHEVFLLHGVTGSGKTEIYLQTIQQVIEKGKEAIVLVPEISLTPQMVNRFKGRFGKNVAVLHSALSKGEKFDEWRKIHRKEVKVVVGARSAIFAPFENLGVIIIDEEHETSYKQNENPRYHARDVAIRRGQTYSCPVILGSATPTLESFARAKKNVYTLLTLNKRTNNKDMPDVDIVDMRAELKMGNRTMFSQVLKEKIERCIENGEQIVLLLNRRGYSTFVMCRDCGHVRECPHCDIALTYHKTESRLKCHYCDYAEPLPENCPECASDLIRSFGTGTQRVEEALTTIIPQANVIRMDVDTTRRKGSHEKLLSQFARGEGHILLGTQMIAKGLDFKNVTLVGVLAADSMLHIPDFRSAEKTFQLVTQVSGRAGRHDLPGEVIVQSYTPEHYSITLASEYNYLDFYKQEMKTRRMFSYPPYVFLVLVNITHLSLAKTIQVTKQFVRSLSEYLQKDTVILGPTPSPIARIKNRYRYQCIIKYKYEPNIAEILEKVRHQFDREMKKNDVLITIDIEPFTLM